MGENRYNKPTNLNMAKTTFQSHIRLITRETTCAFPAGLAGAIPGAAAAGWLQLKFAAAATNVRSRANLLMS